MKKHSILQSVKARDAAYEIARTVIAAAIAFLLSAGMLFMTSASPVRSLALLYLSPFSGTYTAGKILTESVPLIFTGVAVCVMVRCGQFNMFVEGAFFTGGLLGAVIAAGLNLPGILRPWTAMFAASAATGLIGSGPALLKARLGINEFVTSLMFNFVVFWVFMYLFQYHFADTSYSSLATPLLDGNAKLPYLHFDNEISSSVLIALAAAVLGAVFLWRTRWGYSIRMTGGNTRFAEHCGIKTRSAIVYSQIIGSALAGFGGAAFILGNFYRFNWKALPNYGFDGFIVAIIARNNPLLVPIAALFIGYLRTGAMEMARLSDVPNEVVFIIQAMMMLLIGAQSLLVRLKKRELARAAVTDTPETSEAKHA
jgi:simple sugar transport system permease protein